MIKILILASYLLSAMTSWVPLSNHSYYEKQKETLLRYADLAITMATAVSDSNRVPVFEGEDGRTKTGLLMASIASTESGYVRSAVTCKIGGDNGIAWGAWQTHTDKAKTCASLSNAVGMALNYVEISFNWCKNGNSLDKLSGYTDGRCRRSNQSRRKISRALRWYNENPPEKIEIDEGNE